MTATCHTNTSATCVHTLVSDREKSHLAMWDICGTSGPLIGINVHLMSFGTNIPHFHIAWGLIFLLRRICPCLDELTVLVLVMVFPETSVLCFNRGLILMHSLDGLLHQRASVALKQQTVACAVTLSHVVRSTFFSHEGRIHSATVSFAIQLVIMLNC